MSTFTYTKIDNKCILDFDSGRQTISWDERWIKPEDEIITPVQPEE